jgi:hypothetical protein
MAPDARDEVEASTERLAAEAAITRRRVVRDIEALGNKLEPAARVGRVATAGAAGVARIVRRHPIPIVLSLLGLGVLVWRLRRA